MTFLKCVGVWVIVSAGGGVCVINYLIYKREVFMSNGRAWRSSGGCYNTRWYISGDNHKCHSSVGNRGGWHISGENGIDSQTQQYANAGNTADRNGSDSTQQIQHSTQTLFGSSYHQHLHEQRQRYERRQRIQHPMIIMR